MKKLEIEYGAFTYTIIFYLMLCIRFGKDCYITFKLTLHLAGRLFWIFERHGAVLRTRQKNCYKSCLLHLITWNLVQHTFGLPQKLCQQSRDQNDDVSILFDDLIIQQRIFCLTFKFFLCLNNTHREKLFYSVQYSSSACLAASDLFLRNQLSSKHSIFTY